MRTDAPGAVDYALLVSLALLFGGSFTLTAVAVETLPPLVVAAGRLTLAFLLLYPAMRLAGQRLPRGREWLTIAASGLLGNALPFVLVSWGQLKVEAGLASVFMAIMPLATVALAHVATADERMNRWNTAGVLGGLVGVIILMGPAALGTLGDALASQLAILGAALCYAVNAILTRSLVALPRWAAMAALMLAASLWLLPVTLVLETPWRLRPEGGALLALLGLAIGPTATATVLILIIVSRRGAAFLSQINFLVPLAGLGFGIALLGERPPSHVWLALAVILAGIALSRRGASKGRPDTDRLSAVRRIPHGSARRK